MKSLLRSLVASPKNSFYDERLKISYDLTYVEPRIIVCSGPVKNYVKSMYRYKVEDLVRILEANHGSNWHIWNFRGEGKGYDDKDVNDKISYFPFPDHQVPSFGIFVTSVNEIDEFLQKSNENVAVLHCKAGKGRSGSIFCAYAMFKMYQLNKEPYLDESISCFKERRMRENKGDGISIVSQRRYLGYWQEYLMLAPSTQELVLQFEEDESVFDLDRSCITLVKIDGGRLKYLGARQIYELEVKLETYTQLESDHGVQIEKLHSFMEGDSQSKEGDIVVLTLKKPIRLKGVKDVRISIKGFCYAWFHVLYETAKHRHVAQLLQPKTGEEFFDGDFKADWEEFDGFKGSLVRGTKLIDSIQVNWRLYYR